MAYCGILAFASRPEGKFISSVNGFRTPKKNTVNFFMPSSHKFFSDAPKFDMIALKFRN